MKNNIDIAVENNTIISKKVQKYARHDKAVWKSALLNYIVADPSLSQCNFCKSDLCNIARKTFADSWKKMPKLQELNRVIQANHRKAGLYRTNHHQFLTSINENKILAI